MALVIEIRFWQPDVILILYYAGQVLKVSLHPKEQHMLCLMEILHGMPLNMEVRGYLM